MNFKTAALGTMLTAGTMLGGCKKELPEAQKIMNKASSVLVMKNLNDSARIAEDTLLLSAKTLKTGESDSILNAILKTNRESITNTILKKIEKIEKQVPACK